MIEVLGAELKPLVRASSAVNHSPVSVLLSRLHITMLKLLNNPTVTASQTLGVPFSRRKEDGRGVAMLIFPNLMSNPMEF